MLPLAVMIMAGYVLNRRGWVDAGFNRQLSLVLMNLFYPCLIVSSIVRNFTVSSLLENWMMPVGAFFILTMGWVVGALTLPLLKQQPQPTQRCYHFVCMVNNYSFLPILLAASLWGEKAIALIIVSSLGSELCVWTLGIKALTGQKFQRGSLGHLLNLPILALLSAGVLLVLHGLGAVYGCLPSEGSMTAEVLATLSETLRMIGVATLPASALICGSRIAMLHPSRVFSGLMLGTCALRLLVIPALCIAVFFLVAMPWEIRRVLMLIAIQPVSMASVSLAEVYGVDADFSAAAILLTHLFCLVTIPLWLGLILA